MDNKNYLLVDLPTRETLVEFTEDSEANPNNWPLVCLDIPFVYKTSSHSKVLTVVLNSLKRFTMELLHLSLCSIVEYPPLCLAMQSPLSCRISTCRAAGKRSYQQPFFWLVTVSDPSFLVHSVRLSDGGPLFFGLSLCFGSAHWVVL